MLIGILLYLTAKQEIATSLRSSHMSPQANIQRATAEGGS